MSRNKEISVNLPAIIGDPEPLLFSERNEHALTSTDNDPNPQTVWGEHIVVFDAAADERESIDPIRAYFKEINHPLLSYDQQQVLFRMGTMKERHRVTIASIQSDPELKKKYQQVVDGFNVRDREKFLEIVKESNNLAQLLVRMNLRLTITLAKRYGNQGLEFPDLISEGNIGLMKAVEEFDPDTPVDRDNPEGRKVSFSTYSYHWIRQGMTRALSEKGRTIRLPSHMGDALRKARKIASAMQQEQGQMVTFDKLRNELEKVYTVESARILAEEITQGVTTHLLSLDVPVHSDTDQTLSDYISGETTLDTDVVVSESNQRLQEILGVLTYREKRVIELRFGFEDGRTWTLDEIGNEFHVSRERIRQIEAGALNKLKKPGVLDELYEMWAGEDASSLSTSERNKIVFRTNGRARKPH